MISLKFHSLQDSLLTVWRPPEMGEQYVIGADVAEGLTGRDLSVAEVYKMCPLGLDVALEQVAEFAGWVDPVTYAIELFKLGLWYQGAETTNVTLVVERNGGGKVVLTTLGDMGCWFRFRDKTVASFEADPNSIYGVQTDPSSKPVLVSMLHSVIKANQTQRSIIIRSSELLKELRTYTQKPTPSGKAYKYEASGSGKDDRVMATALAAYAVKTGHVFDFEGWRQAHTDRTPKPQTDDEAWWNGMNDAPEDFERTEEQELGWEG